MQHLLHRAAQLCHKPLVHATALPPRPLSLPTRPWSLTACPHLQSTSCYQIVSARHMSSWWGWLGLNSLKASDTATAPTPAETHVQKQFTGGLKCEDEYSWMEADLDMLHRHLHAEHQHCHSELKHMGVLDIASALHREMQDRLAHAATLAKDTPPCLGERIGQWVYSTADPATNRGNILLSRRHATESHADCMDHMEHHELQVVLDHTRLEAAVQAAQKATATSLVSAVHAVKLSPCQRYMALTVPQVVPDQATEVSAALMMECDTGQLLPGGVLLGVNSVEWLEGGRSVLATQPDKMGRPCQVIMYNLMHGSSSTDGNPVLLSVDDASIYIELGRTKDNRYLVLNANSKTTSQVYLVDVQSHLSHHDSPPPPMLVQPQVKGLEYFVEHYNNNLLILTNYQPPPTDMPTNNTREGGQPVAPQPLVWPLGVATMATANVPQAHTAGAHNNIQHQDHGESCVGAATQEHDGLAASCSIDMHAGKVWADMEVIHDDHGVMSRPMRPMAHGFMPSAAHATPLTMVGTHSTHEVTGHAEHEQHEQHEQSVAMQSMSSADYHVMHVSIDNAHLGVAAWKPLQGLNLPHGSHISDMDVFDGWLALYGRHMGLPAVWVVHLESASTTRQQTTAKPPGISLVASHVVRMPLPSWAMHITPGINVHYTSRTLRLQASSPVHPPHTYDYHVDKRELTLLHVEQAAGRFLDGDAWNFNPTIPGTSTYTHPGPHIHTHTPQDRIRLHATGVQSVPWGLHAPDDYIVARMWMPTTPSPGPYHPTSSLPMMPMTLAGHKSCFERLNTGAPPPPVLLTGYGAYGQPLNMGWDPRLMNLMEKGVIVCWAHVRGGGELGRCWAASGRQRLKYLCISDFNAAIKALIDRGLGQPGLIGAYGFSAGGLLVGNALASPDVCHMLGAIVVHLGFLDLTSCMIKPDLPLTAHEVDEWGDPCDPQDMMAMMRVCPYQQMGVLLKETVHRTSSHQSSRPAGHQPDVVALPYILATTAVMDTRVPCWVPAKWVARTRKLQTLLAPPSSKHHHPVLLRVLWSRGHHANEEEGMSDTAIEHAFMMAAWSQRERERADPCNKTC